MWDRHGSLNAVFSCQTSNRLISLLFVYHFFSTPTTKILLDGNKKKRAQFFLSPEFSGGSRKDIVRTNFIVRIDLQKREIEKFYKFFLTARVKQGGERGRRGGGGAKRRGLVEPTA